MPVRLVSLVVLLSFALSSPRPAEAALLPGYDAGTGANTSTLIIDFAFIGGDAYRFDYHYDGDATAEDMLLALDAAGGLTVDHQYFTFGGIDSIYVDGFSYAGLSAVPGFEGARGESWTLWIGDDAQTAPPGWVGSPFGPTDRALEDGSLDGWALNVSSFNTGGFDPTNNPPTTIPEPASAVLLLGGALLIRRRR